MKYINDICLGNEIASGLYREDTIGLHTYYSDKYASLLQLANEFGIEQSRIYWEDRANVFALSVKA